MKAMRARTLSLKRRAGMRRGNGRKTLVTDNAPTQTTTPPNHGARAFNRFVTDRVTIKVKGTIREVPYEPKYISDDYGNRMRNPNWSGAQ